MAEVVVNALGWGVEKGEAGCKGKDESDGRRIREFKDWIEGLTSVLKQRGRKGGIETAQKKMEEERLEDCRSNSGAESAYDVELGLSLCEPAKC